VPLVNQVFQAHPAYQDNLVNVDYQVAMVRKAIRKNFNIYLLFFLGFPGAPGERVNNSFLL
jgi:hypothetical protein